MGNNFLEVTSKDDRHDLLGYLRRGEEQGKNVFEKLLNSQGRDKLLDVSSFNNETRIFQLLSSDTHYYNLSFKENDLELKPFTPEENKTINFTNCVFNNSTLYSTEGKNIVFDNCDLSKGISFSGSANDIVIKNFGARRHTDIGFNNTHGGNIINSIKFEGNSCNNLITLRGGRGVATTIRKLEIVHAKDLLITTKSRGGTTYTAGFDKEGYIEILGGEISCNGHPSDKEMYRTEHGIGQRIHIGNNVDGILAHELRENIKARGQFR